MREGDTVGPFTLGPILGRGGMATVHLGVHETDGTRVAVKVLRPDVARKANFMEAFGLEVGAAASLNHPRITAIFDHGVVTASEATRSPEYEGAPWLAMEFVDGGTLSSLKGSLEWGELKLILLDVLEALGHAHARGMIHRDIKPGNVLLDSRSRFIKLTDFGLVHAAGEILNAPMQREPEISGTPAYMAPEQVRHQWHSFGPWTDLYAVGCMAWALACGHTPHRRSVAEVLQMHVDGFIPEFAPRNPMPIGLLEWFRAMLAPNPDHRFRRAADAAWHLQAIEWDPSDPAATIEANASTVEPDIAKQDTFIFESRSVPSSEDGQSTRILPGALAEDTPFELAGHDRSPLTTVHPQLPREWRTGHRPRIHLHGAGLALFSLRSSGVVGRERERDQLWSTLERVQRRQGVECVIIDGASGSGKTTLAKWLTRRADEVGAAQWREVTHSALGGSTDGLTAFLGWNLRINEQSRSQAVEAVHSLIKKRGLLDREDAIGLVELARPSQPDEESDGLSAHFSSQTERLALLQRYFASMARERPLILWMDELHYNSESMALVEHLLSSELQVPMLLLGTVATEDVHEGTSLSTRLESIVERPNASRISLPALDADGLIALIRDLLGLDLALASSVEQQCGGNPQFAVQLVSDWVERGLLVPSPTGFVLRDNADSAVPTGMLDMWRKRLDGAFGNRPAEELAAIEIGATLGIDVDRAEWEDAMAFAGVQPCMELMAELMRKRLIVANPNTRGWAFIHALFRAAVLERIERNGRTNKWANVAADSLPPDDRTLSRRARFLLTADRTEEALEPLYRAIVREAKNEEWARAHQLFKLRTELLTGLSIDPRGHHALGTAVIEVVLTKFDDRHSLMQRVGLDRIAWAKERGDWDAVALLTLAYGASFYALGHVEEGIQHTTTSLEIARKHRLPRVVSILTRLAYFSVRSGRLDRASEFAREAIYAAESVGDPLAIGKGYNMLSRVNWQQGHYDKATFLNAEARMRFERAGSRLGIAETLTTRGELARAQGDFAAAERAYLDAAARYKRCGSTVHLFPEVNLAITYVTTKRYAEAWPLLNRLMVQMPKHGWIDAELVVRLWATPCLAGDRKWDELKTELPALAKKIADSGIADSDILRGATQCAEQCEAADRHSLAAIAWRLAIDQLHKLNRGEEAQEIEARLQG